ncbi:MAG: hypothetical protein ACREXX_15910 [Gammaproteobacteria bacterium]
MLFFSAAVAGGIIIVFVAAPERLLGSPTFTFARAITYEIMNIYAIKMAGVFMIATSTLALRTGFIARWIAFLGYGLSLLLLFSSRYIAGILMVFPLWVLLVSLHVLVGNLRGAPQASAPRIKGSELVRALCGIFFTVFFGLPVGFGGSYAPPSPLPALLRSLVRA